MRNGYLIGAAALSAAMLPGAAWGQEAGGLRRSLTVEQAVIYDVQPVAVPEAAPRADGLQVKAWADRRDYTYAVGEEVRLFVQANQDAYVTVLSTDPEGVSTVLFPNRYQRDNFVRAGRAVEVPDPASGSRISVNWPVGAELIKVMAWTRLHSVRGALDLDETGAFAAVRTGARGTARSLSVVMAGDTSEPVSAPVFSNDLGGNVPAPALGSRPDTGDAPAGAAVIAASADSGWALCHQVITTIPEPATEVARRARSLRVEDRRTTESADSVRCEEMR